MAIRRRTGRANRRAIQAGRRSVTMAKRQVERARVRVAGRARGPDAGRLTAAAARDTIRAAPLGRRSASRKAVGTAYAHLRREQVPLHPAVPARHSSRSSSPARAQRALPAARAARPQSAAHRQAPARAVRVGRSRKR